MGCAETIINVTSFKKVSLVPDPTPEEVDRVHTEYLAALKELYEEYNPKYGNKKIKLVIRWKGKHLDKIYKKVKLD